MKLTATDVELAIASHFNPRVNLIVPRVSWGFFIHECDMLIVTKSGYAYEVEIKVDKYDLRRDKEKRHGHNDKRIKRLYFAVPDLLADEISNVPEHAGFIVVRSSGRCEVIREAADSKAEKLTDSDRLAVARLGALRIWGLKRTLLWQLKEYNRLKERVGSENH